GALADRAGPALESHWHRKSHLADPRPARRDDRLAVLHARDHQPADAGLARATVRGQKSLATLRTVQRSVAAGARQLSIRDRAVDRDARPGRGVVVAVLRFRGTWRGRCVGDAARA